MLVQSGGFHMIAWMNLLMAFAIVSYSTFLFFKGRKLDKWMMAINALAGLWVFIIYTILLVDTYWKDILTPQEITLYLVRPALFILLSTKLSNIIRIGRRNDH
jgi:hypothetical protein